MPQAYQFKITLPSPTQEIWRVVLIPVNVDFGSFHAVIQVAMGWQNAHLHEFIDGKTRICGEELLDDEFLGPYEGLDEGDTFLSDIFKRKGKKIIYHYDFGDSWEHEIKYEGLVSIEDEIDYPTCIAGAGACPPEDSGGIYGYEGILEILKDPDHDEHEDYTDWLGEDFDPNAFDIEEVNDMFQSWSDMPDAMDLIESFGSMSEEEIMEVLQEMTDQIPKEELQSINEGLSGLNLLQMKSLIEEPLSPRSSLIFATELADELLDTSPYFLCAEYLLEEIKNQGELKLTATGNLPMKLIKRIYELGIVRNDGLDKGIHKVRPEHEMMEVHTVRLLLEIGKFIKKRNNKFSLTQNGKKFLASGRTAMFHRLVEIFISEFNLGFWDGYPDDIMLQHGAGFVLYLLGVHGGEAQPYSFYAQKYHEAFPPEIAGVFNFGQDSMYQGMNVRDPDYIFSLRLFDRGYAQWGLVELIGQEHKFFSDNYQIASTPLLQSWLLGLKA